MEADETLEPPLCSCRMETPSNQDVVTLAEGKCMAVEGVDGKVSVFFGLTLSLNFLYICDFLSVPLSFFSRLEIFWFAFIFMKASRLLRISPHPFFSPLLSLHVAEFVSKADPEAGDDASVSADPVAGAV